MRLLSNLESSLRRAPGRGSDWTRKVRQCCESASGALRSRLERPDSGLYHELPRSKPRLASRVERLYSERSRLFEGLDSVVRGVDRLCSDAGAELTDVTESVRLLIDDLHRHDLEEVKLLQSAYWREVGVGD